MGFYLFRVNDSGKIIFGLNRRLLESYSVKEMRRSGPLTNAQDLERLTTEGGALQH